MVFQIQLFLIHGFYNVVAPCLHGVGLYKSRKNSCSSKTMQHIKTRLVPLHWQGPVHSIDTGIVDLMCSRGCPQWKTTKIWCLFIEGATHSRYEWHSRQLWGQTSGMQQQGLVASRWYKNLAKRCFIEGTENDIRKKMIRSRLSNVSDCHVKSQLALAGTVTLAPFFSCQIQYTQPLFLWYNRLSAWLISPCVSVQLFVVSEYRSLTL